MISLIFSHLDEDSTSSFVKSYQAPSLRQILTFDL